jgi:hypothetical protein
MHNWSVDTKQLSRDQEARAVWRLEQLINYGLDGGRLDPRLVRKYWNRLKLDPDARKFLRFLLWPRRKS